MNLQLTPKAMPARYRQPLRYCAVGAFTTLINVVVFAALDFAGLPTALSTSLAWMICVVFSFAANKTYVYGSESRSVKDVASELAAFISGRLATGIFDVGTMWLLCDLSTLPSIPVKLTINLIVIIANYLLGKLVFKETSA